MTTNIQFYCGRCHTPAVPVQIRFQTEGVLVIDGTCLSCHEKVGRKYDLFEVVMDDLMQEGETVDAAQSDGEAEAA